MNRPRTFYPTVCTTPGCHNQGRPRATGNGDLSRVVLCDDCARRTGQ